MLALARPELVEKPLLRNYLRARGEYLMVAKLTGGAWELPPRTRRIPHKITIGFMNKGTTSAHAENTVCGDRETTHCWNYLRARGEYRIFRRNEGLMSGTTSAHAENTQQR